MTDLVQKLVGALEELLHECEQGIATSPHSRIEARAALSEAKAGGWVAVPVEPTPEMKAEGIKVEVYSEASDSIGALTWAEVAAIYRAMLAARPLPAPPAQRGEG